jgi:acyl-CoA synthetase (AMP-forming)/AMP-acid ligase II
MHKVGAIGKPGYGWECRIVDVGGNRVPPGETGELMVKGPGVMKGYYENPEATRASLENGWLRTGDVAREDEEGFIWLVDRIKDVIITGGENLFPAEIEDFLCDHPKIQDVAVIGICDERLGEIPCAVVQPKPGLFLGENEIFEFCKNLPRFQRPRKVFFDEVPRNPTGKIEKPKLRKKYREYGLVSQLR